MTQPTDSLAEHFLTVAPAVLKAMHARGAGRASGDSPATLGQLRCLVALAEGPQSLCSLARHYGVSAPSMSRMISALVRRGWVSRAEAPEDRRQLVLTLLPPGEAALRDLHAEALDRLSALFAALTPAERAALEQALQGLERAVTSSVHSQL